MILTKKHVSRRSVLKGFTLRNGNAIDYPLHGGGVQIYEASPTIDGNVSLASALSSMRNGSEAASPA